MIDFLKETNLSAYLSYFHKDKKKFKNIRMMYAAMFFMVYTLFVFILGKNVFFLGLPIAMFIGYKLPYLSLLSQKREHDLIVSYLFPEFLQSFIALLSSSGNVYQTLKETVKYTEKPLKQELEILVKNIEETNDREYYLAFAEYVGIGEAYMLMDMIYQFSEFGENKDALSEMESYIRSLDENKVDELIIRKLDSAFLVSFMPIILSVFLFAGFAALLVWYYAKDVSDAVNFM